MAKGERAYTLIGVRCDGGRPALEIAQASPNTLRGAAVRFLNEHTTCESVEAWLDGLVVLAMQRSQLKADGVQLTSPGTVIIPSVPT